MTCRPEPRPPPPAGRTESGIRSAGDVTTLLLVRTATMISDVSQHIGPTPANATVLSRAADGTDLNQAGRRYMVRTGNGLLVSRGGAGLCSCVCAGAVMQCGADWRGGEVLTRVCSPLHCHRGGKSSSCACTLHLAWSLTYPELGVNNKPDSRQYGDRHRTNTQPSAEMTLQTKPRSEADHFSWMM